MALSMPATASRARRALALACVLAAAAGCQPPATSSNPTQPNAAAPTPAASSPAELAALPEASIDSDLEPQDQAAIESLLNSDSLKAYMPSDLINDGGVILYQTMAMRDEHDDRPAPPGGPGSPGGMAPPPGDWKRYDGKHGGRQAQLRRVPPDQPGVMSQRAQVTVSYPMLGQLVVRPQGSRAIQKPYIQTFSRSFRFALSNHQWQLDELSPIQVIGRGGREAKREDVADLAIRSLEVYADGASTPAVTLTDQDRFIKPSEVPQLVAAKPVRLEVALASAGTSAYIYAHLAGKTDRSRQLLVDDGTNGDRVAGDGIYTGTFAVPAVDGLMHMAVDVIDAVSFTAGGVYRSQSVGVSFQAKR